MCVSLYFNLFTLLRYYSLSYSVLGTRYSVLVLVARQSVCITGYSALVTRCLLIGTLLLGTYSLLVTRLKFISYFRHSKHCLQFLLKHCLFILMNFRYSVHGIPLSFSTSLPATTRLFSRPPRRPAAGRSCQR